MKEGGLGKRRGKRRRGKAGKEGRKVQGKSKTLSLLVSPLLIFSIGGKPQLCAPRRMLLPQTHLISPGKPFPFLFFFSLYFIYYLNYRTEAALEASGIAVAPPEQARTTTAPMPALPALSLSTRRRHTDITFSEPKKANDETDTESNEDKNSTDDNTTITNTNTNTDDGTSDDNTNDADSNNDEDRLHTEDSIASVDPIAIASVSASADPTASVSLSADLTASASMLSADLIVSASAPSADLIASASASAKQVEDPITPASPFATEQDEDPIAPVSPFTAEQDEDPIAPASPSAEQHGHEDATVPGLPATDIVMASPPNSPSRGLQGASRVTGGLLRGRAHGNVFNFADAITFKDTHHPATGKVHVYQTHSEPDTTPPYMSFKHNVTADLAPVLEKLAIQYSPIRSKFFFLK